MKNKKCWILFLQLSSKAAFEANLEVFFDLFLTIEEKEMLASRFMIIKALLEDKLTQREIAATYNVSIAQITRGSNALKIVSAQEKNHLISLFNDKTKKP